MRRRTPLPPPQLLGGPYQAPRCRVGRPLSCAVRGDVRVAGITDAPIQWPYARVGQGGGTPVPIVTADLVRAVQTEAAQAVAHHWGVSRWTVMRWRRALGVGRMTPGTVAVWRESIARKLPPRARRRGGRTTAARKAASRSASWS